MVMRWEEWKFSARLAVQDVFVRWTGLAAIIMVIGMSSFLLWRLLPEGWRSGVITIHYNVYLGIDDVRPWPWIFALPGAALIVLLVDILIAFGMFRHSALASRTIIAMGGVAAILWAIGIFFIILVNV